MLTLMGYEITSGQGTESVYLEPECATVGESWDIVPDEEASNGGYLTIKPGMESISEAPAGSDGAISLTFNVDGGNYGIYARVKCRYDDTDAFWVQLDNGSFELVDGLRTLPWQWRQFLAAELAPGEHTVTIAYCEDGAKLDKINISNFLYAPGDIGDEAENACEPGFTALEMNGDGSHNGYFLAQNYPNPFNQETSISFMLPRNTYVSLKVFDLLGIEVAELCGKEYQSGNHTIGFNADQLSDGNYFYRIKTNNFSAIRRMILQSD